VPKLDALQRQLLAYRKAHCRGFWALSMRGRRTSATAAAPHSMVHRAGSGSPSVERVCLIDRLAISSLVQGSTREISPLAPGERPQLLLSLFRANCLFQP
jgi:hypothetical protein